MKLRTQILAFGLAGATLAALVGGIGLLTVALLWLFQPRDRVEEGASVWRELGAFRRVQVWLTLAIASVAAHLHQRGITHGDLYAHNILCDEQGNGLLPIAGYLVGSYPVVART